MSNPTQMTTKTTRRERSSAWTSASAWAPTRAGARVTDVRVDKPTRCLPAPGTRGRRGTPSGPVESGCFRRGGCRSASSGLSAFSQLRDRAGLGYGNEACALAHRWCLTTCPPTGPPRGVRANHHWGHVHAGQHIMHELSLTHAHPAHHRLPSTRKPAHSPRPATPDDNPTPLTRPGQNAGHPAHHHDDDSAS